MNVKHAMVMGIPLIAVVGAMSLNLTPKESLGCGGTEFASGSGECPVVEFQMTLNSEDWEPIARKMCFRTLKSEAGCTVYQYSIVSVTEEAPPASEPSAQYVNITYGRGCDVNRMEGSLIEVVDEERVVIALAGTPTRAPIPMTESAEPLAMGACTSSKYAAGEFELLVAPPAPLR